MTPVFQKIILFSLIPVVMMILGGGIAILRQPKAAFRSAILHFAAGVVFSVVAVELLPDIVSKHSPVQVVIGFVFGIGTMFFIKRFAEAKEKKEEAEGKEGKEMTPARARLPMGLLVAIGVDIIIDGLLLGIGFAAGEKEGTLLAFALSIELLSLGMATASELGNSGVSKRKTFQVIIGLSVLFFASAFIGETLLHNLPDKPMEIVLSFGLSALLFLVTEELLVEAHEEEESPWLTSTFFAGFLLFLILGMVL